MRCGAGPPPTETCCRDAASGAEEEPLCKHEEQRDTQSPGFVPKAEALRGGMAHLTLSGFCVFRCCGFFFNEKKILKSFSSQIKT